MAEWDAEFAIDSERVRRAAGSPARWRRLGTGWDCDAWIADETTVWRVPRRRVGIAALEREAAAMPILAPRLPAPVPVPRLIPAPGLPALACHAAIPGRELAEAGEGNPALGAELGRFLRALHDPELARIAGERLPADPLGRADPGQRVPLAHRRLDAVEAWVDVTPLRRIVDGAAGSPLAAEVICHGDLHVRHVLVDEAGTLAGVIDWGDCCRGARAVDLAIVTALPPESRAGFFASYGAVDEVSWRHARLLGVLLGAALLAADPEGRSGRAARVWLERLGGDLEGPPPRSSRPG
jgi:aminoglycoside phosphotransferase (APT) family kinase protein